MRAITEPWQQLILTFVLYCFIEYIFTLVAYEYFWMDYGENGEMCKKLWVCFLINYDMTFKFGGGVGAYLDSIEPNTYKTKPMRTIYDTVFNFTLAIVLMQIFSGIIIDTFGLLRDQEMEKNIDKKSNCFICGLKR